MNQQTLFQQAAQLFQRGQLTEALSYAEQAYQISLKHTPVINLYGALLSELGQFDKAIKVFERGIKKHPKDAELLSNFGLALKKSGDYERACLLFHKALMAKQEFHLAELHLANTLKLDKKTDDAITHFKHFLAKQPEHAEAHASLADTYETTNQLELASEQVDKALAINAEHILANLVRSQIDLRQADNDPAILKTIISRLQQLLKNPRLTLVNRCIAYSRLANAQQRIENYSEAFSAFSKANETIRPMFSSIENLVDAPYGKAYLKEINNWLTNTSNEELSAWRHKLLTATDEEQHSPIFMLGFPRSGTTLLERMLSGNEQILAIEEHETLKVIQQDAFASDNAMAFLLALTDAQRMHYQQCYWQQVANITNTKDFINVQVLDKLPLNTIHLPFIMTLFPRAKIILTIRDPRAVTLSCFMQRFGINQAMSHFLSLKETVSYYQQVMGFGLEFINRTQLSVHQHHYEDLVNLPTPTLQQLMRYLELDYTDEMLQFHTKAQSTHINTPSYEQVAKPIYTEATERWRHYQAELAPELENLASFIERFGYSAD